MRVRDDRGRREPPPLLMPIGGPATANGISGYLHVEVGPFGEQTAHFVVTGHVPGRQWVSEVERRGVRFAMADGRTVALKQGKATSTPIQLSRGAPVHFEAIFAALGITARQPAGRPRVARFPIANPPLRMAKSLQFDGLTLEPRDADVGDYRHAQLVDGDSAPVECWLETPVASLRAAADAFESVRCLTRVMSLLCHERVLCPGYHVCDPRGTVVQAHFGRVIWPAARSARRIYTRHWVQALEAVGQAQPREGFRTFELARFVDLLLEAMHATYAETRAAGAIMALECIGTHWCMANRWTADQLVGKPVTEKLKEMNKSLKFMDRKFLGDWLRKDLRNPLMHTGVVPTMTLKQVYDAGTELLVLATDIFFRLLGFDRRSVEAAHA